MKRMAVTGFIIWAAATIALRLGGQYVFGHVPALLLLLITLPVMMFVTYALLQRYGTAEQRALAAIALVAPGMLLDTISTTWLPAIFPNLRSTWSRMSSVTGVLRPLIAIRMGPPRWWTS